VPSSGPNPLLDPFGALASEVASLGSDAETATGLAGASSTTSWSQLTAGFQSWLNAGSVTEAQWGTLSPDNQQALANAYWIQNSAGGNAGNLLNLAAGAQSLSGVGDAGVSPATLALSPFAAVGNLATSGVQAAVAYVFQAIGNFLSSFVTGALQAGGSFGSSHVLGLVVALAVVMVLFH
jgi:hypothetical protein